MVTNGSHSQVITNGSQDQTVTTVQNVKQCVHMLDEHMRQNVIYENQYASMLSEHT